MKPIISVEGLSKRYRIREKTDDAPTNFREVLADWPRRLFKGGVKTKTEDFWALRDVSFDIMPGDRVGIIGRNGAGKSTLLKLLSRITEPTAGRITLRGRTASLLEVGTGFHPELTGRENIFLNGAILGMTRAEVSKKFDEIVAFAGVEKFLETPVKRYSSGMYVRLGFAVAAHLEPDILVVDEVLAVGDAEFQKKCLGKMEEVSTGQGRTVLFVSHQLSMIRSLCNKGVLLQDGVLSLTGDMPDVLNAYSSSKVFFSSGAEAIFVDRENNYNSGKNILVAAELHNKNGRLTNTFVLGEDIILSICFDSEVEQREMDFGVSIFKGSERITSIATWMMRERVCYSNDQIQLILKNIHLCPGIYSIQIAVSDHLGGRTLDCVENAFQITIANSITPKYASRNFRAEYGFFVLEGEWRS